MQTNTIAFVLPVNTGPSVNEGPGKSLHSSESQASAADVVTLSPEGVERSYVSKSADVEPDTQARPQPDSTEAVEIDEQAEVIRSLQARDLEVRTHEQAHKAAGGELAAAPSYGFRQGPDGRQYAVSGEVSIDVSEVAGDPAATIDKMARVRRAALAPAEPSSQDRQVAAQATQRMNEARAELAAQQREILQSESELASIEQEARQRELDDARTEQTQAEDESEDNDFISVADRFAEYNARLRQINETLLRISMPPTPQAGSLLDDEV